MNPTLQVCSATIAVSSLFSERVSGDRVRVDHPEALVIRGGVAVFVSEDGAPVIFDHEGVSQVIATPAGTAAA